MSSSVLAALEIKCGDVTMYAAWNGGIVSSVDMGASEDAVEIPVMLAQSAGLPTDHPVMVDVRRLNDEECGTADAIGVDPVTEDDWEIVESHASHIENHLLEQVSVVAPGMVMPFWVHSAMVVRFRVTTELPAAVRCARLLRHSEVHIAPKPRRLKPSPADAEQPLSLPLHVAMSDPLCTSRNFNTDPCVALNPCTLQRLAGMETPIAPITSFSRVHVVSLRFSASKPSGDTAPQTTTAADHPSDAAVTVLVQARPSWGVPPGRVLVPQLVLQRGDSHAAPSSVDWSRADVSLVQASTSDVGVAQAPVDPPKLVARQVIWKTPDSPMAPSSFAPPPRACEAWCNPKSPAAPVFHSQLLVPHTEITRRVQAWLLAHPHFPVTDGLVIAFVIPAAASGASTDVPCFAQLQVQIQAPPASTDAPAPTGNTTPSFFTYYESWQEVAVYGESGAGAGAESGPPVSVDPVMSVTPVTPCTFPSTLVPPVLPGRADLLADCTRHVLAVAGPSSPSGPVPPSGLLVAGGPGSGSSSVAAAAAACVGSQSSVLSHTVWVDCAALRHQKLATVTKRLRSAWEEAARHAPSVIVLDGLDALAPKPEEGPAAGSPADQQAWLIAEVIDDLMTAQRRLMTDDWDRARELLASSDELQQGVKALAGHFQCRSAVSVVATVAAASAIQQQLRRAELFSNTVDTNQLTVDGRAAVLRAVAVQLRVIDGTESGLDWVDIATHCDGYSVSDLRAVVQRAQHEARVRDGSTAMLCAADVSAAMDGFTPAFLRGVKLFKSDVEWTDVGGLVAAKTTLKETLEFPVKFAPLYSRSPLRMPSGVLLYGPPGCGKTMLAAAVAQECGLRFLSVKGPEVLDKYIGASEQAIRDLFVKAAAAAPSVLFFDEFDALAPRRGSGSTGVTDRVVNQLLTFLDGVESRGTVFVLAATSRPDLVDPALLRPGRLDKHVLCDFPDVGERTSILEAICTKISASPEVRSALPAIAGCRECTTFTGADLQALMYSAQLEAAREALATGSTDSPVIQFPHLSAAFASMTGSVSEADRRRYQAMYEAFASGRGPGMDPPSAPPRVALK